jgi:hypothetical protein
MAQSPYNTGETDPNVDAQKADDWASKQVGILSQMNAEIANDPIHAIDIAKKYKAQYPQLSAGAAGLEADKQNALGTYGSGSTGAGNVKGLFNTQSALFGGSTEGSQANMDLTWRTAGQNIMSQQQALNQASGVVGANNAATGDLTNQANAGLLGASNMLNGQGAQALTVGGNQTGLLGGVQGPAQSGSAAMGQSVAGLQNYAQQGPGPSVAQSQLAQSTDATMKQAIALGSSGRGAGVSGAAQAAAGSQAASALSQGSQQMALLRAQEQAQWRQQQLQAYEAAGQVGNALQGQNVATSQFALGQQQAAAQNELSYQQLNQGYANAAAQQQAAMSQNTMQRAALGQNNAATLAGYNMTYGQEQAAALSAAQAQQQAQLSTEAQLRVGGIGNANSTAAGLQATAMNIDAQRDAAQKAADAAMIGAGLQVGGAVVGGVIGGPAGAAGGAAAGNAAGKAAYAAGK